MSGGAQQADVTGVQTSYGLRREKYMSELERIYTVPLSKAWVSQKYRRAEKAMTVLKKFTERHMKPSSIIIHPSVNEAMWSQGIKNPPRKIRVKMTKESDGAVTVTLAEE